ncbi:unnamed protein product [Owenia fusiformis]|uniref:Uncharacterized protein n=1 Tax=Owenia fusiformis TaxID=6347 RepID=A0A8J1UL44_OWEFU|nr:unnamed protein product [Owenia fusiformis]
MKHPHNSTETFSFNLGKAPELRCVNQLKNTVCGECETCHLVQKLILTRQWFQKSGDHTQKRFLLGLIRRFHSIDLLEYIVTLLQPLLCKDFTYARTRTKPSLETDRYKLNSDRALNGASMEQELIETWYWFQTANYWTKCNFILGLMRWCDAHLLHLAGLQARTLLASERKVALPKDNYESSSIASSTYSLDSHAPHLQLLMDANPSYSPLPPDPLADTQTETEIDIIIDDDDEIINDDSGDDDFFDNGSDLSSLDPTCLVIPTSSKAYSGVSLHKDFIRSLPVHLSKYILGFLDKAALHNALCVSSNWRHLVEEVHKEFYVNQQLWEEVQLMQGMAAQSSDPNYANDIDVPVPNLDNGSWDVIKTSSDVVETKFKTEMNLETAYSGISKRNIIMEERNVYCGAYNVMVLTDQPDAHRCIHTNGLKLTAIGSKDRHVKFLHNETGREIAPVCIGHAGSVRCVALCEQKGYVLSGSYDLSIRKWSLETGKPLKILRGHRDTITCMEICGDRMASGAKDHLCKVWNLETGKSIRTFKHRHAVCAVALSKDRCISGCEGGKVKVWELLTGKLIKRLTGHHGPITGIKFDKWHLITASKDGYALVWSNQGNHKRCLNALRHPKEVLCLEFMYLRVITGSEDGKVRIWNMVTGQCLRIMRGNSRSEPITSLIAIDDRITLNSNNSVLVLNFEPIEWDYFLESDKLPAPTQYASYSNAPVRTQPYSLVRANRMERVGATDMRIIHHDKPNREKGASSSSKFVHRPEQLPRSAMTLSQRVIDSAKQIQKNYIDDTGRKSALKSRAESRADSRMDKTVDFTDYQSSDGTKSVNTLGSSRPPKSVSTVARQGSNARLTKPPPSPSRAPTAKSRMSAHHKPPSPNFSEDSDYQTGPVSHQRRLSWAFENPQGDKSRDLTLSEAKYLWRSQIRASENVIPPDYVYLTISAMQGASKTDDTTRNTAYNLQPELDRRFIAPDTSKGRPSSGPSRVDPRTKVPVSELGINQTLQNEHKTHNVDYPSDNELSQSQVPGSRPRTSVSRSSVPIPQTQVYTTGFSVTPVKTEAKVSAHPKHVQTSIPKGRIIRPHTSGGVHRTASASDIPDSQNPRPVSAAVVERPGTALSVARSGKSPAPGHPARPTTRQSTRPNTGQNTRPTTAKTQHTALTTQSNRSKKSHGYTTSATDINMVPMLMYPQDMAEKINELKQRRIEATRHSVERSSSEPALGKVSLFNHPMRTHVQFKLMTNQQTQDLHNDITKTFEDQKKKRIEEAEKKQRDLWLQKAAKKNSQISRPKTAPIK